MGGILLIRHLVALPTPPTSDRVLHHALETALVGRPGNWRLAHVMYRTCTCSRRTIEHLVSRGRLPGTDELVVMVDDAVAAGPQDAVLRAAGFTVLVISPATLRDGWHVESTPLLVVARPDHEVVYVGGYNRHKQSPRYEDVAIVDELRGHHVPATLPVFGCATSARLASALDPLGLAR